MCFGLWENAVVPRGDSIEHEDGTQSEPDVRSIPKSAGVKSQYFFSFICCAVAWHGQKTSDEPLAALRTQGIYYKIKHNIKPKGSRGTRQKQETTRNKLNQGINTSRGLREHMEQN